MSAREENSLQIKPLTKRSRMTGELYTRRAEVERQLAQVVSFDNSRILELLKNKSRESEEYLFDETIVYLLREWSAEKKDFAFETLYLELNRRVWRLLKKFYKNFAAAADFEDFGQKIELAVIEKIFDLESDSADYAQINFGHFVVTQAKVFWSGNLVKIKREEEIFYSPPNDEDGENKREMQFAAHDISPEEKLILREAIAKLPDNIRNVAVLILDGWQIESKDETQLTISKHLKINSRTIRNWLNEARRILAGYEGEIR